MGFRIISRSKAHSELSWYGCSQLSREQVRLFGSTLAAIRYVRLPEAPASLVRGDTALQNVDRGIVVAVQIGATGADMPALAKRLGEHDPTEAALLRGPPRIDLDQNATGPCSLVAKHRDQSAGRGVCHAPVEATFGGHIRPRGLACAARRPGQVLEVEAFHRDQREFLGDRRRDLVEVVGAHVARPAVRGRQAGADFAPALRSPFAPGERPCGFHLEQMDDGKYWIGLTPAGQTEERQCIMLTRKGKNIYPTVYR